MFRIQDNVPEVYINESRDFQILARISDILFSGIKYDIDSMVNILDATLVKDRMLQLMCTKVGFFPKIEIDSQVLKYIIASFPYIIKNKGNELGIKYAVNAILKAENNPENEGEPIIDTINKSDPLGQNRDPYTVYIYSTISIYNKNALKEILKYVLPAGYSYKLLPHNSIKNRPDIFKQSDLITMFKVSPMYTSSIRGSWDKDVGNSLVDVSGRAKKLANQYRGAFDTTVISTHQDNNTDGIKIGVLKDD